MKRHQVPLTPAVFHILLALADGPLHGYGIMQAVETSASGEPAMGPGTIYGSLQRMEEAGLVTRSRERDDRRMVLTQITARGRELLGELDRPMTQLHREQLSQLTDEQLRSLIDLLTLVREGSGG